MTAAAKQIDELLATTAHNLEGLGASFKPRQVYPASRIKKSRSTKAEIETRRKGLRDIVRAMRPMTVRQVFYQATIRGLVPKDESGYDKVQTDLALMRRNGDLPYDWLVDNTRWQRKPLTYADPADALRHMATTYRKDLWLEANAYVEVWLEKDALAGVLMPVTSLYDVPLMVSRGYASLSFLHSAAEFIRQVGVPTYIYHCGDYDPSGQNAAACIEDDLRRLSNDAEIYFERLAVTPDQIVRMELPSRPTKKTDSRAKGFAEMSVELDAIEPGRLRDIVELAIQRHLPADQLRHLQWVEQQEREGLLAFADLYKGGAQP